MSTITKEQMLKWAAAWQVMITLVVWYMNEFGVDTINRLLFGVALVIAFLITFLKKDNTEKIATAVGALDDFLEKRSKRVPTIESIQADIAELQRLGVNTTEV